MIQVDSFAGVRNLRMRSRNAGSGDKMKNGFCVYENGI